MESTTKSEVVSEINPKINGEGGWEKKEAIANQMNILLSQMGFGEKDTHLKNNHEQVHEPFYKRIFIFLLISKYTYKNMYVYIYIYISHLN